MTKCPRCGNESIKTIKMLGLTIITCIFKGCKYRLTIDLINNKVRTDKEV
jgi:hypothetical protein